MKSSRLVVRLPAGSLAARVERQSSVGSRRSQSAELSTHSYLVHRTATSSFFIDWRRGAHPHSTSQYRASASCFLPTSVYCFACCCALLVVAPVRALCVFDVKQYTHPGAPSHFNLH